VKHSRNPGSECKRLVTPAINGNPASNFNNRCGVLAVGENRQFDAAELAGAKCAERNCFLDTESHIGHWCIV
jgi:hypothetical protein